jgi:hypothetical protein
MSVKMWGKLDGHLVSEIKTRRRIGRTVEESRPEAEVLDQELDRILDGAVHRLRQMSGAGAKRSDRFRAAWVVGRALNDSQVFALPAMQKEDPSQLWEALTRKIGHQVHSDRSPAEGWTELRPEISGDEAEWVRRDTERPNLNYFEMCRWLAEQDFPDAQSTFGPYVRNVWQMLERSGLRHANLRRALLGWLSGFPQKEHAELTRPKHFAEIMKRLRQRWPGSGRGPAMKPVHFAHDELVAELDRELTPLASRLLQGSSIRNYSPPPSRGLAKTKDLKAIG